MERKVLPYRVTDAFKTLDWWWGSLAISMDGNGVGHGIFRLCCTSFFKRYENVRTIQVTLAHLQHSFYVHLMALFLSLSLSQHPSASHSPGPTRTGRRPRGAAAWPSGVDVAGPCPMRQSTCMLWSVICNKRAPAKVGGGSLRLLEFFAVEKTTSHASSSVKRCCSWYHLAWPSVSSSAIQPRGN